MVPLVFGSKQSPTFQVAQHKGNSTGIPRGPPSALSLPGMTLRPLGRTLDCFCSQKLSVVKMEEGQEELRMNWQQPCLETKGWGPWELWCDAHGFESAVRHGQYHLPPSGLSKGQVLCSGFHPSVEH